MKTGIGRDVSLVLFVTMVILLMGCPMEIEKFPITAVEIQGELKVGETLTAVTTPAGATVTYQWMISDTEDGT